MHRLRLQLWAEWFVGGAADFRRSANIIANAQNGIHSHKEKLDSSAVACCLSSQRAYPYARLLSLSPSSLSSYDAAKKVMRTFIEKNLYDQKKKWMRKIASAFVTFTKNERTTERKKNNNRAAKDIFQTTEIKHIFLLTGGLLRHSHGQRERERLFALALAAGLLQYTRHAVAQFSRSGRDSSAYYVFLPPRIIIYFNLNVFVDFCHCLWCLLVCGGGRRRCRHRLHKLLSTIPHFMPFVPIFTFPHRFSSIRRSACRPIWSVLSLAQQPAARRRYSARRILRHSFLTRFIVTSSSSYSTGYFSCIESTCGLALSFRLQHIKRRTHFFGVFGKHNFTLLHALILSTVYIQVSDGGWCAATVVCSIRVSISLHFTRPNNVYEIWRLRSHGQWITNSNAMVSLKWQLQHETKQMQSFAFSVRCWYFHWIAKLSDRSDEIEFLDVRWCQRDQ